MDQEKTLSLKVPHLLEKALGYLQQAAGQAITWDSPLPLLFFFFLSL